MLLAARSLVFVISFHYALSLCCCVFDDSLRRAQYVDDMASLFTSLREHGVF